MLFCTWREGYISDCYQGLSKDYTRLQRRSCYTGVLARRRICTDLCPHRQTYGVSHTVAFSVARVPVKMLYRLFLRMPILAPGGLLVVRAQGHVKELHSKTSLQCRRDGPLPEDGCYCECSKPWCLRLAAVRGVKLQSVSSSPSDYWICGMT